MKKNFKKEKIFLIIFIILIIAVNYSFFDQAIEKFLFDYETALVNRIIDGDTVEINKSSYRLLGINTPEKGELFYEEAKQFLESIVLNQTVKLHYTEQRTDKYYRDLVYIYLKGSNINAKIVEGGFANIYYPSKKDSYYSELYSAWETCLENNINLCEKSLDSCSSCIELVDLNVKEQFAELKNICSFDCDLTDWTIKDEGRKNYVFGTTNLEPLKSIKITAQDFNEDYVWTSSGDTLFLRDDKGKLVIWESY